MTVDRSKHDEMFAHVTESMIDLKGQELTRQLVIAFGMWGASYTAFIFREIGAIDEDALADFIYNYAQHLTISVLGIKKRGFVITTPEFRSTMDTLNALKDAAFASIDEIANSKWKEGTAFQKINRALFLYLDCFDNLAEQMSRISVGFRELEPMERTAFMLYSQVLRDRLRLS